MDPQTIADEIRGLITLALLDEARAVVDRSNLDDPEILEAVRRYFVAVEDWERAAQAGLSLLNFPEKRTWITAHCTALALHKIGRTAQAALLLYHYPPDDCAYERSFHFYALACYSAKLGRHRNALRSLHASLEADSHYCSKAFVDHDLRGLWQWLGDLRIVDEELAGILGDSLWIEVLAVAATSKKFTLDPSDLELHPKFRNLVSFHPSRAVYEPRRDIGPRSRRVLHAWLQSRSRWAIRRLQKCSTHVRRARARQSPTANFISIEQPATPTKMKRKKSNAKPDALEKGTSDASAHSKILDHLEKTALSGKPELAAKQQRLLNILRQQQQD